MGYNAMPLSGDGRYALFASCQDGLVPGDHNGFADDFVLDRQTGALDWASAGLNGDAGNGSCLWNYQDMSLSEDGEAVAFTSEASNLAPYGTTGPSIYLRDRTTGVTHLASVTSTGATCSSAWDARVSPGRTLRGLRLERPRGRARRYQCAWPGPISGAAPPGRSSAST